MIQQYIIGINWCFLNEHLLKKWHIVCMPMSGMSTPCTLAVRAHNVHAYGMHAYIMPNHAVPPHAVCIVYSMSALTATCQLSP
jgi:hypothetical protein